MLCAETSSNTLHRPTVERLRLAGFMTECQYQLIRQAYGWEKVSPNPPARAPMQHQAPLTPYTIRNA